MRIKINAVKILYLFFVTLGYSQTQMEINEITNNNFIKADNELNKLYKNLIKILPVEDKNLLVAAQKDWIKFRNSDCKYVANKYNGGSVKPSIIKSCFEERTLQRLKELKEMLKERKI